MRPQPPEILLEEFTGDDLFVPSDDLEHWARSMFIADDAQLRNPDHEHLEFANIGWLWTNVPNRKGQREVVGQAEVPMFRAGKWQAGRQTMQMVEWFGSLPDFVITLDARYAARASDAEFCALVEHELYHCAQMLDKDGIPMFGADERPRFAIRDHDVTEFVGVVRRYGIGVVTNGREFVEAALAEPSIEAAELAAMCGNCAR